MKVDLSPVVWTPNPNDVRQTQVSKFAASVGFKFDDYDALHRWSVSNPVAFWSSVWTHSQLLGDLGEQGMVESHEMGKRHFFPAGRVNIAENLLRHDPSKPAILQMSCEGELQRRITYGELKQEVEALAGWMISRGVKSGDVVATISTSRAEAVLSFLATAAIGAIWTSASPDMSAKAIIDRIGQVKPVMVFACVSYIYSRKARDISETVRQVEHAIPSIQDVVLIGDAQSAGPLSLSRANLTGFENAVDAPSFVGYDRIPFNSPYLILYTSGTTGKPKAIVHSGGGVLLRLAAEHRFQTGLESDDVFFWYTSIAWMMFHWLVMALESGVSIVLYEDAAVKKGEGKSDVDVLWRIAQNAKVTVMGLSPNYLKILQRSNYRPNLRFELATLRAMFTSGAPMPADLYAWLHANVSSTLRINSISGGSEVMSAFLTGSPIHSVRAGEMCCQALGMAVEVFDERGVPVVGREGELVVTQPFPSMPLTFWGERGDERYKATYFEAFPGVWTHGDVAEQRLSGGFLIHGRSDNTIKPGGVRIGTAEMYYAIDEIQEIEDAVIFGRPWDGDEEVVLCVQMASDRFIDDEIASQIRSVIRARTSPRHVPAKLYQVSDVPKTQNGKRNEAAAKAAALGRDTARFTSLANPNCLMEYAELNSATSY